MSYILDALLKAEQERQRSAAPTLRSVHTAGTGATPDQRKRWFLMALAALGGGLLIGGIVFLLPQTSVPQPQAQLRRPATQAPAKPVDQLGKMAHPAPEAHRSRPEPPSLSVPAATAESPPETYPASRPKPRPPVASRSKRVPTPSLELHLHESAPLPSSSTEAKSMTAGNVEETKILTKPKRNNQIVDIGELPAELRQEVQKNISVAGASFSADNNERMAIINDRARRAGEEVIPGMKLEAIQSDGIILSYKGYRFRTSL